MLLVKPVSKPDSTFVLHDKHLVLSTFQLHIVIVQKLLQNGSAIT